MKTIKNNVSNTYIVNKSKFITYLFYLDNIDEVQKNIDSLREKYFEATHLCYGYIFDNVERFSDDHEPNGTAGIPILNVLKKMELNHVLAVVVRFFGGIKLGAGNLTRTYSSSVKETLKLTEFTNIIEQYVILIKFNYDNTNEVNNIIGNDKIIYKEFNDIVVMRITTNNPNKYQDYLIEIIDKKKVKEN